MRPLSSLHATSVLALLCANSAATEFRLKNTYDASNFFDSFDFLTVWFRLNCVLARIYLSD